VYIWLSTIRKTKEAKGYNGVKSHALKAGHSINIVYNPTSAIRHELIHVGRSTYDEIIKMLK
jgi:hypothetical protein